MKNRVWLILLATALVVSLVGVVACAKEEEPPEEWEWPDKLHIATSSSGTADYAADMGYGILLEEDTGMKVRCIGETNYVLKYQWMKQGRFFWSNFETMMVMDMMQGVGEFASRDGGPWQQRMAYASGSPYFGGFAVRGDSGIITPHDLKPGMKIGYLTIAPIGKLMMEALLAWAQIDSEDIMWIPASTPDMGAVHLMDGRIDVSMGFVQSPIWYEAEAAPHGLAWIELDAVEDPEGLGRFQGVVPQFTTAANQGGVPSAQGVHMICDIGWKATREDTDPELVYRIVKWMDENFDRFKEAHPYLAGCTIDMLMRLAETSFVPLHEGTIRYLEEKGLWTDAHEARQQANIELMTTWCEAYQTAIDMADEQGISVSPKNEEWLELWENYKKDLPQFKVFPGLD